MRLISGRDIDPKFLIGLDININIIYYHLSNTLNLTELQQSTTDLIFMIFYVSLVSINN